MEHIVLFCLGLFTGSTLGILVMVLLWAGDEEEAPRVAPAPVAEAHLARR